MPRVRLRQCRHWGASLAGLLVALNLAALAAAAPPASPKPFVAPPPTEQGQLVQTISTSLWDPPSPDPMGIVYQPDSKRLIMTDSEVEELPDLYAGANIFELKLDGTLLTTHTTLSFSSEPTDIAYNPTNGHWFITDDDRSRVFEIDLGGDKLFGTSDDILTSFNTRLFNGIDAEGIAFDSARGHLLIADDVSSEIYDLAPGQNGIFDGVPPAGDDVLATIDTYHLGIRDPEGVVADPTTGNLYIVGHDIDTVVEITVTGRLVRVITLPVKATPSGITIAPTSSNAQTRSLYITDRGKDNDINLGENDGKLFEILLTQSPINPVPISGIVFLPISA